MDATHHTIIIFYNSRFMIYSFLFKVSASCANITMKCDINRIFVLYSSYDCNGKGDEESYDFYQ